MEYWKQLLRESVHTVEALQEHFSNEIDLASINEVIQKYPIRINPYFLKLAIRKGTPLLKQVLPDVLELQDTAGYEDPLAEEDQSPVPNLTHRYPNRCLFLISSQCAFYCRFCTRKRKVGDKNVITDETIKAGIKYIEKNKQITDVILSGGDPLLLSDAKLEEIIKQIKTIKHVQIIRLGTRVPSSLPQRITESLVKMLRKYHPIFINTHFNHPDELSEESKHACELLVNNGFPLNNQAVLLKGINDNSDVLQQLFHKLLTFRIRPYYLYQADLTRGTNHFRTSIETGISIMRRLRGRTSGLAIPNYVIDSPGGGGKVPVLPKYIIRRTAKYTIFRNYEGKIFRYPEPIPNEVKEKVSS